LAEPAAAPRKVAVIAAGGTGGHLFPAQALAEALIARDWRIVLATDERVGGFTASFPAERIVHLPAATPGRRNPLAATRAGLVLLRGVREGQDALDAIGPSVVVGFGGYPSVPALAAAVLQRRRTVIHEQNAVSGRANRLLAPFVTQIACAFPGLAKASRRTDARKVVVGNPVRPEIRALAGQGYTPPDAGTGEIRLLITGGSQGARFLSELIPAALATLPEALRARLKVVQQTRPENLEAARAVYANAVIDAEVSPFFRDIAQRLAAAHLVIGRAGASTVTELMVAGRPSVLIPLGHALDDDQGANAAILAKAGGAEVAPERATTRESMTARLAALLADPDRLAGMAAAAASLAQPDAADRLADLVEATAR
jgi:UDP-N-acetylglucosamine--N-acetylmuramyl-(pentapeptide) pyrophosphoryl-undecaprenol N-acetylglucosamine transferase